MFKNKLKYNFIDDYIFSHRDGNLELHRTLKLILRTQIPLKRSIIHNSKTIGSNIFF